jgi:hypothetical protein
VIGLGALAAAQQAAASGAGGGGGGDDPYWQQVSSLLAMSADFTDAKGLTWTPTGASVSGGEGVWDGVNDYLRTPASVAFCFGRSDYTVEGYTEDDSASGNRCLYDTRSASSQGLSVYAKTDSFTGMAVGNTTGLLAGVSDTLSSTAKTHWALVRDSGTARLYIGGVQKASVSFPSYMSGFGGCSIGDNYIGASQPTNMKANHFRVTRGFCRYPGGTTFTPPVGPFPTSGGTSPGTGPGAHRYWRLLINANDGNASYMGVTQLVLRDRQGVIVSGWDGSDAAVSASSEINEPNKASNAFNGLFSSNAWLSATAGSAQWVKNDFGAATSAGAPVEIKDFDIYAVGTVPDASPKDFKLQWSDNNSTWTDALTVTGETGWTANEQRTFTVF